MFPIDCLLQTEIKTYPLLKLGVKMFSEQYILDMISTLDANKAVGPDIIGNKMLIAVKVQISKPLWMLFHKYLHQNIFPTDWKLAHVIPLFKAGDKSFPSNNRPVSLLSCVSKLLEKIGFRRSPIRSLLTYFCYGCCCLAILKMKIFSNFLIGE